MNWATILLCFTSKIKAKEFFYDKSTSKRGKHQIVEPGYNLTKKPWYLELIFRVLDQKNLKQFLDNFNFMQLWKEGTKKKSMSVKESGLLSYRVVIESEGSWVKPTKHLIKIRDPTSLRGSQLRAGGNWNRLSNIE